jgi:phosphoribosylformylglycinamidine cyclo-ligase
VSSRDSASTYDRAGVDYERLDAVKRRALAAALGTSVHLAAHGAHAVEESRGESAFLFELDGTKLGMVLEGLGTKAMIATAVQQTSGLNRFADIGYDAVAAILNDLICVGALPLVVNAYFATGSGAWYDDTARATALLDGWARACADAECAWGGGESPSLPGLVSAEEIELAGCAIGKVPDSLAPPLGQALTAGDEIVLIASSGLHANGASLARAVADSLADGWQADVDGLGSFGELVLAPTLLYVKLVRRLFADEVPVSYLSHITGHGFLKLMRAAPDLGYRITTLPEVPAVLRFITTEARMPVDEAYSTLNMGAGFAVYVADGAGGDVVRCAHDLGFEAVAAGRVCEGPRRVEIPPLGVNFDASAMRLRA